MASQTNVITLAPKKPNWDLKRDTAKKLDKLERRTQRAIYDLLSMYRPPHPLHSAHLLFFSMICFCSSSPAHILILNAEEKLESEGQGADNLAAAVEAGTKDMTFADVD